MERTTSRSLKSHNNQNITYTTNSDKTTHAEPRRTSNHLPIAPFPLFWLCLRPSAFIAAPCRTRFDFAGLTVQSRSTPIVVILASFLHIISETFLRISLVTKESSLRTHNMHTLNVSPFQRRSRHIQTNTAEHRKLCREGMKSYG